MNTQICNAKELQQLITLNEQIMKATTNSPEAKKASAKTAPKSQTGESKKAESKDTAKAKTTAHKK